jgi:hypothetical protein
VEDAFPRGGCVPPLTVQNLHSRWRPRTHLCVRMAHSSGKGEGEGEGAG